MAKSQNPRKSYEYTAQKVCHEKQQYIGKKPHEFM